MIMGGGQQQVRVVRVLARTPLPPIHRDTAGQERYKSMAPLYYRGAHAAHIVLDITRAASFHKATSW